MIEEQNNNPLAEVPSNKSAKPIAKWLDNEDNQVEKVFGFNRNAELVNSRAAMIGFLMLIFTELVFGGQPVTLAIFGIK